MVDTRAEVFTNLVLSFTVLSFYVTVVKLTIFKYLKIAQRELLHTATRPRRVKSYVLKPHKPGIFSERIVPARLLPSRLEGGEEMFIRGLLGSHVLCLIPSMPTFELYFSYPPSDDWHKTFANKGRRPGNAAL